MLTWYRTTAFRCLLIKPDLPLPMVKMIAGRQQARSQAVSAITYTQTMSFLHDLIEV
jgi:hypothetical protein